MGGKVMRKFILTLSFLVAALAQAYESVPGEYVIRFKDVTQARDFLADQKYSGMGKFEILKTPAAPMALVRFSRG